MYTHSQSYINTHSHTYSTEVEVKQEVKAKKSKGAAANSTGSRSKRVVNDIRYIAIIHLFYTILRSSSLY